ncbi:brachyurin-like isoform X2 [Cloeon dipterum]|uniref:brachyurin-like isoform X2 n=1 Tax=Cloeon dipterum TaxID=197152 RepID=UPI00321FA241
MNHLLVLFLPLLQLASVNGADLPTAKIINGTIANDTQFPWHVSVFVNGTFTCSGSLISPRWILTAGHCIGPGNFSIRLGATKREEFDEGTMVFSIPPANIFRHPNFSSTETSLRNDIAMIKLPIGITFPTRPVKNATIAVIKLPSVSAKRKTYVGEKAIMSGWGQFEEDGDFSDVLNWAINPVIANADCQAKFSSLGLNYVYNGSICTSTSSLTGTCEVHLYMEHYRVMMAVHSL